MDERRIGTVEHYYPRAHAATVKVDSGVLRVGDQVHIVGPHDDRWEEVTSLEVDHVPVEKATTGDRVGVWLSEPVHAGADVFRLEAVEAHEAAEVLQLTEPPM